ncbi:MAG: 50S ribosomal protein L5 [Parcubacteria group bacterium CG10_big_fil_rev_8_21_14_0_10_38_31]|nr:MAG: 50S ribosomal protein L5 [Parcubacteria group bacterium CG10_big_fil_rev_8_21_14_0_10_38_31]
MQTIKEKYNKTAIAGMKEKFGYKNEMSIPKIVKIVVNVGTGSMSDKKKIEEIEKGLAKITGQKPSPRAAKKSIATFKLREGSIIGYAVTLRGEKMDSFLEKLINVTIPRMRDFKGLNVKGIDDMGNFSIGIKDHLIFPEAGHEDLSKSFGLSITIVTDAKTKEESEELLRLLGFPFSKK